jgi:hypothetical protein
MVSMKPKKHSGKEWSDISYSVRHTHSTTLENYLGAARTHFCPAVLYAKKGYGDIECLESSFAACASYAIWVTGTKCYKDQLTEMLNVLGSVLPKLSYENLVNTLLISVQTQWHNMCTFIDSFYVELTGVAGFNKEKEDLEVGLALCCCSLLFLANLPLSCGHAGGHGNP